ncbi:hypothetical protein, partial [Pseudomonas fragi]
GTAENSSNSLKLKEFSVSTAPEVGRIIDSYKSGSSTSFTILSYSLKSALKAEASLAAGLSSSI